MVVGQVFFVFVDYFMECFDFKEVVDCVIIDLYYVYFWDVILVVVLDKVVIKFCCEGMEVDIIGMNEVICIVVDKFGVYDKLEEVEKMMVGY